MYGMCKADQVAVDPAGIVRRTMQIKNNQEHKARSNDCSACIEDSLRRNPEDIKA